MFTSASTKRCECFVWAQPAREHMEESVATETAASARPWYYGAPDPREGGENSQPRIAVLPAGECGQTSAEGPRWVEGEGDRASQGRQRERSVPVPGHSDARLLRRLGGAVGRACANVAATEDGRTPPVPAAQHLPPSCLASSAAFTLIEVMVASAIGLLVLLVVVSLSWYSGRSFVAVANYVDLDQNSQLALDKMSREIRQAHRVTDYSPTRLSLLDIGGNPLSFVYDPDARTLVRVAGGQTSVLLSGCDSLEFAKYQHTAISNTFDAYDPAFVTNTRLIQVTWKCSRKILGAKVNTESVQSAKIALRNN